MIKYDDSCECSDCCCNTIEEDVIEDEICECCQDKIDAVTSFLEEYVYCVDNDKLDINKLIEMVDQLYDGAYHSGKIDALETISEGALRLAYGEFDDLT